MNKSEQFVSNWVKSYLQNRDLFQKTLKEVIEKEDHLDVTFKSKTQKFYPDPYVDNLKKVLEAAKKNPKEHFSIVCFNTKENVKKVISSWKDLTEFFFLSLYFINPWSTTDKQWILHPKTHDRVTEKEALTAGLESLSEGVVILTKDDIDKKI